MSIEKRNYDMRDFYAVPLSYLPGGIATQAASLLGWIELLGGKCWIAGGALRDAAALLPRSDLDVFFASAEDFRDARARLLASGRVVKVVLEAEAVWRAETSEGRIDLVRKHFVDPLATVQAFDFVACCAALSTTHFAYHRSFLADAQASTLRLSALPMPRSTVRRLVRLEARGWNMTPDQKALIVDAAAREIGMWGEDEYEFAEATTEEATP